MFDDEGGWDDFEARECFNDEMAEREAAEDEDEEDWYDYGDGIDEYSDADPGL